MWYLAVLGSDKNFVSKNVSKNTWTYDTKQASVQRTTIDTQPECIISYTQIQKGGSLMQAYCMKCRTKREMSNPKAVKMKNGKPATQGVCPKCGTKMFRIGKS